MKKNFILFFLIFSFSFNISVLSAMEEDNLYVLFEQVPKQSVDSISTEDVAIIILKAINVLDKNLRVANDNNKISLYYKTRLIKSLYKPKDRNDAKLWADLAGNIFDTAINVSSKAKKYDFEAFDNIMLYAIKDMGKDAKYFIGGENRSLLKQKRTFAARMEEENLYIKIGIFNKFLYDEIINTLNEHKQANGIILDLRGCPGGQLSAAIDVADAFLDQGIIASVKGKPNEEIIYYNAKEGGVGENADVVVLVDGDTASAAEVLAQALQDQGRAKVVGTKTFGKGSIQNLIDLPNGSAISVTSAYIYSPSGQKLSDFGVMPDVCTFEMPESKDENRLINAPRNDNCLAESRRDSLLDEKIAQILLKR